MHFRTFCYALVACITGSVDAFAQPAEVVTPIEAIIRAAEAATNGQRVVSGVFELVVNGTGRQDSLNYLNSEVDYRDQRSLTAAILPGAEPALKGRFGADFLSALKGKRIRVTGAAQRVTIWFYCDGKKTDKYYFQTHIPIFRADQIIVIDK